MGDGGGALERVLGDDGLAVLSRSGSSRCAFAYCCG
jgi:hypothetical protein